MNRAEYDYGEKLAIMAALGLVIRTLPDGRGEAILAGLRDTLLPGVRRKAQEHPDIGAGFAEALDFFGEEPLDGGEGEGD